MRSIRSSPRVGATVQSGAWLAIALLIAGCSSSSGSTTPAAEAFAGGTLRIVVPSITGGGYDLASRVVAAHLGRHLPGSPAVIVDNMAGAGGLIASNFLARQAPRDGLTVGFVGENSVLAQLSGDPAVQFDVRQFAPIGAPAGNEADVCVMSAASGLDLNAWRTSRVAPRMAVTSLRSGPYARLMLLTTAMNLRVRPVVGYQGTAQIRLAMDGGEVEGMCTVLASYKSAFEPKANYRPVLQDGAKGDQLLEGVAVASDIVPDARGRTLLDLAARVRALPRYLAAPPGTPADRLQLLRSAWADTMRDPEYLRAAAAARLQVAPLSVQEITARIGAIVNLQGVAKKALADLLTGS